MKIISKVLASRLKSAISSIVNENQVAYINNRFISESGRLISDVLEITNSVDIEGILMTVDIEKAFDFINHSFLMYVLPSKANFRTFLPLNCSNFKLKQCERH